MPEVPMQRADPLIPLAGLLADLGVSPNLVFGSAGLTPDDVAPGRFLPFESALKILDVAVEATGREDLGLLLGSRQSLDALGPLSQVMRTAASLGDALLALTDHQLRNSSGASAYAHRYEDQVFIGYGVYSPELPVSRTLHDVVLAVGDRVVTELTRGAVRPREYVSMRTVPRDPSRWATLGAKVRFGEAETGFYLDPSALSAALPTANKRAHAAAIRAMLASPIVGQGEWTQRTRHALRRLLLEGRSPMPDVARSLGVGPRTLRRGLAGEGATFEQVRDGVRFAIARDVLYMSRLSVAELAVALDFATPTAFIRAFRRWTGETPAQWRQSRAGPARA